jgi:hypothetical protein
MVLHPLAYEYGPTPKILRPHLYPRNRVAERAMTGDARAKEKGFRILDNVLCQDSLHDRRLSLYIR